MRLRIQYKDRILTPPSLLTYCILRDPDGERTVDVVPGGTELESQVKTGSWAGRTHSQ
jgi:hypothetical protein